MSDVLQTGRKVVLSQLVKPSPDAPEDHWITYRWPFWCKEASVAYELQDGTNAIVVPELLDWQRRGDYEEFDIELRGGLAAPVFRERLITFLKASQGANAAVPKQLGPNRLRIALSHYSLPDLLPFDPNRIPASIDETYVGLLNEGSDLVIDWRATANAMIAGQNGSGKSETVKMVLAQLWAKGWELVIITPTEDDSTFEAFDDLPRCEVFYGATDDALEAVADRLTAEDHRAALRQKERGAVSRAERAAGRKSVAWWGDPVEGHEWDGHRSVVFMDETKQFVTPTKSADSGRAFDAKVRIQSLWARRHQQGRKTRQHCLSAIQQPSVPNVGGGEIINEIGFFLAIRALRQTFVSVMFPQTESPDVNQVLITPGTPPGRGIARGARPPSNEFAGQIDDTPVQVAWIDEHHLDVLLGLASEEDSRPDPDPVALVAGVGPTRSEPDENELVPTGRFAPQPPQPGGGPHLATIYAAAAAAAAAGVAAIFAGVLP